MISLHEALASVDRVMAKHRVEAEALSTVVAMGRILAADQRSKVDLPPFNKSAMDGYAVMEDDRRDEYRILETVAAGEVPTRPLEVGAATKVMTGAPVPVGSGRVIMVEDTDGGSEIVCVREHRAATNICCQGEDIRVGQVIMKAGAKLTPVRVANLVACGVECVAVSRRIRVAIYATGDEIVDAFEDLVPGKIMNENGPMLEGLCRQNDLEVTLSERVPDNRAVLKDALEKAAAEADMILMSGGVSAGDFDFVPAAMADAGFALHFDSVAVQPGKPVTFATRGRHVVLGMPGNPVSVFITFHLYARRIAAWLSGAQPPLRTLPVKMATEMSRRRAERAGFIPCLLNEQGHAEPLPYHGSAHLLAIGDADGFIEIPIGVKRLAPGDEATFYPLALGMWR